MELLSLVFIIPPINYISSKVIFMMYSKVTNTLVFLRKLKHLSPAPESTYPPDTHTYNSGADENSGIIQSNHLPLMKRRKLRLRQATCQ